MGNRVKARRLGFGNADVIGKKGRVEFIGVEGGGGVRKRCLCLK